MEKITFQKKPTVEIDVSRREEEGTPSGTTEQGPCRVRIRTDRPCLRPAVVEVRGVPFCERCARKQEAYFAIGELTQELASDRTMQARDFRDGLLAEVLNGAKDEPTYTDSRTGSVRTGTVRRLLSLY